MRKISPLERCVYPLCELLDFIYAISLAIYVSEFTFYCYFSLVLIF